MNLSKERDRDAFWRAWRTHLRMLRPFRQSHKTLIEDYVGSEYAAPGDYQKKRTLRNLMFLAAESQTLAMTAHRPRVQVTTRYRGLRPFAKQYQTALNMLIEEIRLEKTLRRVVMDAFFCAGFVKIYYAPGQRMQVRNPDLSEPGPDADEKEWATYRDRQNIWVDPGSPFCERISIKDVVFDMSAEQWEKVRYVTHQYRVPFDWALDDDRLDRALLKKIGPTSKWGDNRTMDGEQSAADISRAGYGQDHDELEPMITLVDYWLSAENRWGVTIPDSTHKPLYETQWEGAEAGPFKMLSLADVPDNIMPTSPGQQLRNLHVLSNQMLRKAARQALDQKTVATYTGDGKDARQIQQAADMEMVRVNSQDSVKEHRYNGVDRTTLAFGQIVDALFDQAAGNLSAKMGTGPSADTATQESLLFQAMGAIDAKKQLAVVDFTTEVCSDLGLLLYNDEHMEMEGTIDLPGISVPLRMEWKPGVREGLFRQYGIRIEPYSMAYKSPTQEVNEIIQLVSQIYVPLMPMLIQAGGALDMQKLTEVVTELRNLPRLNEIVVFTGEPMPGAAMEMMGGGGGQPHEYIRRNVSGGSPQGQRSNTVQALLSGSGGEGGMETGA